VLEDSHYQPFAGIYSTYMISNDGNDEVTLNQLCDAIKCVYASVFYKSSKAYMEATMNVIDEEHMGIVLQEVVGQKHDNVFYPTFSGVARSINFYPIPPEKAEDGIVNVALGLGKQIVEGEVSLRFVPAFPKKILQLSSPQMAIKGTQKHFYALDLDASSFVPSVNDGINLKKLSLKEAEKFGTLRWVGSVYDPHNNVIRDGLMYNGIRLVTFANILKYDAYPLAQIIKRVLEVGQEEMNQPVEVEFAVDLETPPGKPTVFYLLQVRPIVDSDETITEDLGAVNVENTLIYSHSALGNGVIKNIYDVVYVKPETFNPANNVDIVPLLEKINVKLLDEDRQYILIGPGRWGSQDPWLGIPVKWTQISGARVIVENVIENYHVDPSQGTHFFQNLTSLRVGYFHVNSIKGNDHMDVEFLNKQPAVYEDEYIRHVRFEEPSMIKIDGKNSLGVVFMPGYISKIVEDDIEEEEGLE
jgi:phosphoenolpyruvate synthase/pyruvate phosphate dikinase